MTDLNELAARVEALTGKRARPFGDYYAITEDGRIWSTSRDPFFEIRQSVNSRGYLCAQLSVGGVSRKWRSHRAIAIAFYGDAGTSLLVRHLDDDKTNNDVSNLAWGTVSDNSRDAVKNGRCRAGDNSRKTASKRSGDNAHNNKIRSVNIAAIKSRRANGETYKAIAADYGVDRTNIFYICKGATWQGHL